MQKIQNEHQYAFDVNGKWVNASKTEFKEHQTFFCDCPQRHKMKLVKPSGDSGKRSFADYFAHIGTHVINTNKRQKVGDADIGCSSGGESMIHRNAKHMLRECVGSYFFATVQCPQCSSEVLQHTHGCTVSLEVVSEDKQWRYDCLLRQNEKPLVAMEVVHRHLSGLEKIQSVRGSGLEIVEFRAMDVLQMQRATQGQLTKLENIKIMYRKCWNCLLEFSYMWARECFESELLEVAKQENEILANYVWIEKMNKENELKIKRRLCQLVNKANAWIYVCLIDEIQELQRQADYIAKMTVRVIDMQNTPSVKGQTLLKKYFLPVSLNSGKTSNRVQSLMKGRPFDRKMF